MRYWLVQHTLNSYQEHKDLIGKSLKNKKGLKEIQQISVGDKIIYKIEDMKIVGSFKVMDEIGKWEKDTWKDVYVYRIKPIFVPERPVDFRPIAKQLKWKKYHGITASEMDAKDFKMIDTFIKNQSSKPIPEKPSHNTIRDMIGNIGEYEGWHIEKEFPTEEWLLDVIWKRKKKRAPSHVFEVHISGDLYKALAKLKYAHITWGSKPILITTESQTKKATHLINSAFHEMGRVVKVVDWKKLKTLFELEAKIDDTKKTIGEDIFD